MCILFLYVSSQPEPGKYRIILASNRDEHFLRPAKPAHFWESNSDIIAGMDMTPGKEGGTWLAASRKGRIAVLLNYLSISSKPEKKGRGSLASGYVAYEQNPKNYLKELQKNANMYNPFHLVAIDLKETKLYHYCNVEESEKIREQFEEFSAFTNGLIHEPFMKAISGSQLLKEVYELYGKSVDTKDILVEKLLGILKNDSTEFLEDDAINKIENISPEMRKLLSTIFVKSPDLQYGTRTHTIILVDNDDNLDFYEWTLKIPVENNQPEWIETHHQIKLDLSN